MASFEIHVAYAQLAVFDGRLDKPFNNWTRDHVRQGFSWRPGSVSFGTLQDGGPMRVEVIVATTLDVATSEADRIISVPFTAPDHGEIEVSSIDRGVRVGLTPGEYELTFEHGCDRDLGMWVRLYFGSVSRPVAPCVIRADAGLTVPVVFTMSALPA
jgi:hypothetical protein